MHPFPLDHGNILSVDVERHVFLRNMVQIEIPGLGVEATLKVPVVQVEDLAVQEPVGVHQTVPHEASDLPGGDVVREVDHLEVLAAVDRHQHLRAAVLVAEEAPQEVRGRVPRQVGDAGAEPQEQDVLAVEEVLAAQQRRAVLVCPQQAVANNVLEAAGQAGQRRDALRERVRGNVQGKVHDRFALPLERAQHGEGLFAVSGSRFVTLAPIIPKVYGSDIPCTQLDDDAVGFHTRGDAVTVLIEEFELRSHRIVLRAVEDVFEVLLPLFIPQ